MVNAHQPPTLTGGKHMPIRFNYLLVQAGIDPSEVRLVRHQDSRTDRDRTPYRLWSRHPDDFMEYQSRQSLRSESGLGRAKYWAVFVAAPPHNETLFVGLYAVLSQKLVESGIVDSVSIRGEKEDEHILYDLKPCDELSEFNGKLVIEWGKGSRSWAQRADNQDKMVLEVRRKIIEEKFIGYLAFISQLSEIDHLPNSWIDHLREAKGVYLLTCPRTGENYVGSATGEGGFHSRWQQHAAMSGDAIRFKTREPSDLRVCILETAGSGMLDVDIIAAEYRWIEKLKPALNGHVTLIYAPKDA